NLVGLRDVILRIGSGRSGLRTGDGSLESSVPQRSQLLHFARREPAIFWLSTLLLETAVKGFQLRCHGCERRLRGRSKVASGCGVCRQVIQLGLRRTYVKILSRPPRLERAPAKRLLREVAARISWLICVRTRFCDTQQ